MGKPDRASIAAMRKRPMPPTDLYEGEFRPAPELIAWAHETFIDDGAVLENPDHHHLKSASLGALWTDVANGRHMRSIVATCELGKPMVNGRWQKARAEMQIRSWFGCLPDFILTFHAEYAAACSDAEFCAVVEHELLHAGQERDPFGAPKFRKSGGPAFAMRGHDVEEFVGIVRRYGPGAAAGDTGALVAAASKAPEITAIQITKACGACLKVA